MQLRACVWPGSRSADCIGRCLGLTGLVDEFEVDEGSRRVVAEVLHFAGDVEHRITEAGVLLHLPVCERLCLPTVKALPGVTSRGAFLSSLACCGFGVSVDASSDAFIDGLVSGADEGHPADDADEAKAKMITRTTSQVRRLCSDGGKGFLSDGSGAMAQTWLAASSQ
jgi:hypothetical protein